MKYTLTSNKWKIGLDNTYIQILKYIHAVAVNWNLYVTKF